MKILRRLAGHKTTSRVQGLDHYARARCTCGATFEEPDGRFMLYDFERWERDHRKPETTP